MCIATKRMRYWLLGAKHISRQIKGIVLKSLDASAEVGLMVKSIVCDRGPLNQGLAKELNICKEKPYFIQNGTKIYFIYDVQSRPSKSER
jgi:hypothetical protein